MSEVDQPRQPGEPRRLEGDLGANLVEYALLLALILIVCLGALTVYGKAADKKWTCISSSVEAQVSNQC